MANVRAEILAASRSRTTTGYWKDSINRAANNNNNNCNNDNNMVLNTEWIQIDLIELDQENEHGLGFGIVGGRSSGVIVKTIIPGGAAAKVGGPCCVTHLHFFYFFLLISKF